jgi:hypothetical protein
MQQKREGKEEKLKWWMEVRGNRQGILRTKSSFGNKTEMN